MLQTKAQALSAPEAIEDWDPLGQEEPDPGLLLAALRRQIRNILKSYTGSYDLFAELLQNALDAVERRAREEHGGYTPTIWIKIDLQESAVSVTDNGYGMPLAQFQRFLKPNISFKDGVTTRGSKGVGATYLAYGHNYLEVATKFEGKVYSGVLREGREWVEDTTETVGRPRMTIISPTHPPFLNVDRGTSMTLKLTGQHVRNNLRYSGATTAEQWAAILRVATPLGGIYLCTQTPPRITVCLEVIDLQRQATHETVSQPTYVYPHTVLGTSADLREYLKDQAVREKRRQDLSKKPPKYTQLNGIWGEWTGEEILIDKSPIKPQLDSDEQKLVRELDITLYTFLGYSTDLWDAYNDTKLRLRKGLRLLEGGLQLATRNMPQGRPLTIPITRNIYFQNIAHVIVHMDNAEPDLGRKGFQPEHVKIAEKLAVSAVTIFAKYYDLLRAKTGAPDLQQQMKLEEWVEQQKSHELKFPLVITGRGLFLPTEELAIRSTPLVEQDVVALFNQMLSSGIIRGIQLLASSQYKQYDGLYRIKLKPPFSNYTRNAENPLGVEAIISEPLTSAVKVLEYKYNVDGLIEEFQTGEKSPNDVSLVVAWEMGSKWQGLFDVLSYLDEGNAHHRQFHGATHSFSHSASHTHAFEAIILKDLVEYLSDPIATSKYQHEIYSEDLGL
ncbi:MAG TPA: ATP-binding protein [Chloroflexia bacterium]